jgi:hypothetical protein
MLTSYHKEKIYMPTLYQLTGHQSRDAPLSVSGLDRHFQSSRLDYTARVDYLLANTHITAFSEDENATLISATDMHNRDPDQVIVRVDREKEWPTDRSYRNMKDKPEI